MYVISSLQYTIIVVDLVDLMRKWEIRHERLAPEAFDEH